MADIPFEKLIETVSVGLCRLRARDGVILAANQGLMDLLDVEGTPDDLIGRPLSEFVVETECGVLSRAMAEPGRRPRWEGGFQTAAGVEKRWVVDSLTTVDPETGETVVDFMANDITAWKQVERALRRERDRAREYFDIAEVILILLDRDGRIRQLNRKGGQVLGYPDGELLGENWFERCLAEESRDEVRTVFKRLMRGELEPSEYHENPVVTRSGEVRTIAWHNVFLRDETGRITGTLSSGQDITERRRSEKEIRRLNEELEDQVKERTLQLEAANRELSAFAYSVSHDLRAPLRSIDGFSLALQEDCGDRLGPQGADHLRRVRGATERMGTLIDGMLTLSAAARSEMHEDVVNLSALARDIARHLGESEPERDVEWVLRSRVSAYGDARLLELVMRNLLENAWKFSAGRARARIEFGVGRRSADTPSGAQGQRLFFVGDNGAGFDQGQADKLFAAFQRLHATSEFPGTGIGLATVQRIVHRHGGHVWAKGRVNRGATVCFSLPRRARRVAPAVGLALAPGLESLPRKARNGRAAIPDDPAKRSEVRRQRRTDF